jgi:uncharacterized protein (DUF433 family)
LEVVARTTELWRERLHLPAYRLGEAATYSKVSPQTVVDWERQYNSRSAVLSRRASREGLSFLQLIELAVVAEMRRLGVSLKDIRDAREYLSTRWGVEYPFAVLRFKSDGVDILMDRDWGTNNALNDKLLTANRHGQYIWPFAVATRLMEFNYGRDGHVDAWRVNGINSEIEITPKLAFGAPQIRGVATAAIRQRWEEGFSTEDIADDLEIPVELIEEALKFEGQDITVPRGVTWRN